MNSSRTILAILATLATAAGCHREPASLPPEGEPSGDSDLSVPADLAGQDARRPDLWVKRGWTRVEVPVVGWLNAVWGSGPGDVYVVGMNGAIFHSTGDDVWTEQKTGRLDSLTSVFGSSATDVYAIESAAALHTTGDGHWSVVPNIEPQGAGTLGHIWMSSPTNIYVSGDTSISVPAYPTGGVNIMRWKAPTLTREFAQAQHHIAGFWGTDATDLWAVGSYIQSGTIGLVLHSTGDGLWTRETFQPDTGTLYISILSAVWSSSRSDVYVASATGRSGDTGIFRSRGSGTPWRRETDKLNPPSIAALWGSGPTDVWAVGTSKDGPRYSGLLLRSRGDGRWQPDPELSAADAADHPFSAIWGSRFGDVYVVGHGGVILHKRE